MSALVIVLTGGIASGKSAAADQFVRLGVPLFDADVAARNVVAAGTPALKGIVAAFGADALTADGQLDRRRMRDRVFANMADRKRLESIVHPHVRSELLAARNNCAAPYCVLVVPLFAEFSADYAFVDRVLVVDVPLEVQLDRVMTRDRSTREGALRILSVQAPREQRLALADDVIDNGGDIALLGPRIERLHRRYKALAGE